MSHENRPYFPFYANDFLTSTVEMEPAQVGMYIRLLAYEWVNGPFTSNFKTVCRLAGIESSDADATSMLQALLKHKFSIDQASKYSNRRLEIVRAEALEKSIENKAKAKKAAERRWEAERQKQMDATSNATSIPISNAQSNATNMLNEDEDEDVYSSVDTGIVEGSTMVMSSNTQLSGENEKSRFAHRMKLEEFRAALADFRQVYNDTDGEVKTGNAYREAIEMLMANGWEFKDAAKMILDKAAQYRSFLHATTRQKMDAKNWLSERCWENDYHAKLIEEQQRRKIDNGNHQKGKSDVARIIEANRGSGI